MAASVRKHCGKQGASRTVIWPKGFPSWRPVDAGVAGHSARRAGDRGCAAVPDRNVVPD
jgi:hypothetical protein